ncbi:hypothetical protein LZ198_00450 [Myxococcus sp. K15C18031901]|uniref:ELWxxDGT repeat protein n=1 Tax=Myxococcus dinghuensis TaxID=2906761 RepID=UPI0020A6FE2B|nr:ELWxxDGT repeat protein [Myxococcus dinghuensis]MCP3097334.1 hypothetical protein [Myxococcus dinghuensis]
MRYRRWTLMVVCTLASCSSRSDPFDPARPDETPLQSAWEFCSRTAVSTGVTPVEPVPYEKAMAPSIGGLVFAANDGTRGNEPWVSNGSPGTGTRMLVDLYPGAQGSNPGQFTQVGDRVFFAADDPVAGRELFVSDGTTAGTRRVSDIWPGPVGSFPDELFAFEGLLYFAAGDPIHGRELWRSDGTSSGTFLVEDLEDGIEDSSPRGFTLGGDGSLYFFARVASTFTSLMRSNGDPGAVELLRIPSDPGFVSPLVPVDNQLFFVTGSTTGGLVSLMRSNAGAAPVTVGLFGDVNAMADVGGTLLFSATPSVGSDDMELWRSDGTTAGTWLVEDIQPGPQGSYPDEFTVLGDTLFFAADDGVNGREPWDSDGTAVKTRLFGNLQPGAGSSSPEEMTTIEDHFFFRVEILSRGDEPWVSDGVRVTTVALTEPAPGPKSSSPRGYLRSGWNVFFVAADNSGVRKLYALPFRPAGSCTP